MAANSTSFKFGNNAWKARSKHGRNPKFSDPTVFEDACYEYFEWVQENPLIAADLVKFQGESKIVPVPKMRAMTIDGLCAFLDISDETWRRYRTLPDFSGVVAKVERIIRVQKLEGAAADMLNSTIVARLLGLKEHQEQHVTGKVEWESDYMRSLAAAADKGGDGE